MWGVGGGEVFDRYVLAKVKGKPPIVFKPPILSPLVFILTTYFSSLSHNQSSLFIKTAKNRPCAHT